MKLGCRDCERDAAEGAEERVSFGGVSGAWRSEGECAALAGGGNERFEQASAARVQPDDGGCSMDCGGVEGCRLRTWEGEERVCSLEQGRKGCCRCIQKLDVGGITHQVSLQVGFCSARSGGENEESCIRDFHGFEPWSRSGDLAGVRGLVHQDEHWA